MQSFNAKGLQPSVPEAPSSAQQFGFGSFLLHLFQNSSLKWLGAGVSLMLFVAVISLSYTLGVRDVEKGAVPIIVSDGSPVKVRPQNPGGKQFPYQDVSVYQTLRGEEKSNESVILADAPEQPMEFSPAEKMQLDARPSMAKESDMRTISASTRQSPAQFSNLLKEEQGETDTQPIKKTEVEKQNLSAKPMTPEKTEPVKKEVAPVTPATKEEKVNNIISLTEEKKETPPPMASTSSAYLQLGAYRSNAEAEGAWKKISAKLGGSLKASNHIIVKADIPGKGTYYRLRVGPYNSRLDANVVCKNISAKGQGCMPVTQ